jgi:hypothetical protein
LSQTLARLRMGMPDYLRLTGDHLFCLWIVWTTENDEKVALADYLAAHAPVPFADSVLPPFEKSRAPPFPRLVRTIMLTTGALLALAALLTIIGLLLRCSLALSLNFSGICGIVVHAGLILSALGSAGIPRYTIGLWPPMVVGILFFGAWVARKSKNTFGNTTAYAPRSDRTRTEGGPSDQSRKAEVPPCDPSSAVAKQTIKNFGLRARFDGICNLIMFRAVRDCIVRLTGERNFELALWE